MATKRKGPRAPGSWHDPEREVLQSAPEESMPAEPAAVLDRVVEWLGDRCLKRHSHRGDDTVEIAPAQLLELMDWLRADTDLSFDYLMDLCGVDGLRLGWKKRFRVVYHLWSSTKNHRLRVKVRVGEDDPVVPTLSGVWPCADWYEREVWDMFGVRFEGHPNLKRILLYEEFEGHPLRKDYPIRKRQPLIGPNPSRDPQRVGVWPAGAGAGARDPEDVAAETHPRKSKPGASLPPRGRG